MYASESADQSLTFVVSGKLWQRSLVMMDEETGSLWSHLLGRCMEGELEGETLDVLPSTMTDWQTWSETHPETSVLMMSRTTRDYRREFYRDPSRFVLGIREGTDSKAFGFDRLTEHPVVNKSLGESHFVIVYDATACTANVFNREVDGRRLTFEKRGDACFDVETGTQWHPVTGEAISGELSGSALAPMVGIPSYRVAWMNFHPDTAIWEPEN